MSRRLRVQAQIGAFGAIIFVGGNAYAAPPSIQNPKRGIEEVVVTATRRVTKLQKTPIAVTVLSGRVLSAEHITNALDLTTVLPNVNVNAFAGIAQISIRGIGSQTQKPGDDPRIAFYTDDIYVARPFAQLSSFFDIDQLEVLRGPQGTLFGRNATGGALSLTTRQPTDTLSGYLNLTGGNYGLFQAEGAVSGPLTSTLDGRVAFETIDRGGYATNEYNGKGIDDEHEQAVRVKLRWTPSEDFSANLILDYSHEQDANGAQYVFDPITPGAPLLGQALGGQGIVGNIRNINENVQPDNYNQVWGGSGNASYRINDHLSLKGIVGVKFSDYHDVFDPDGTTESVGQTILIERSKQESVEVRLAGDYSRFNWTVGLYNFDESDFVLNHAPLSAALFGGPNVLTQGIYSFANYDTNAYAAFAQATVKVTSAFSVTAGIRYSYEDRSDNNDTREVDFARPYPPTLPVIYQPGFPRTLDASFRKATPHVSLNYNVTDNIFTYFSFSTGFKSGGFNYGSATDPEFLPETIHAYELGLKSSWLDHRLQVNVALFDYDYTNIQVPVLTFTPVSAYNIVNAASSTDNGVEFELIAEPIPALRVDVSAAADEAKFANFVSGDPSRPELGLINLRGNWLPEAPKFTLNIGAQYTWNVPHGDLTVRGEYQRIGEIFFTAFNTDQDSQGAYNWVNAFVTYKLDGSHWTATLFGRNLTDTFVKQGVFDQSGLLGGGGGYTQGGLLPPRTFGGTLSYRF